MITIENFAQPNDGGCYVNVLIQIKTLQGKVLREQFLPGSIIAEKVRLVDFWEHPSESFIVDVTNLSSVSCNANVSFVTDLGVNTFAESVPNGFTLRYLHLSTAAPLLAITGSGQLTENPALPPCTVNTSAAYNEMQKIVTLTKLSVVEMPEEIEGEMSLEPSGGMNGYTSDMFPAGLPNVSYFAGPDGVNYLNPWFFKAALCGIAVDNVELCGTQDIAGIGQYINLIPSADLIAIPEGIPAFSSISNEDYASTYGRFQYRPNKTFTRFQTLPDSRMFDLSASGSIGRLTPKSSLSFKLPFSTAAYGALKKLTPTPVIVVFTNGTASKMIVGTINFPAYITAVEIKQSSTDSYIQLTLTSSTKWPMFFTGNL